MYKKLGIALVALTLILAVLAGCSSPAPSATIPASTTAAHAQSPVSRAAAVQALYDAAKKEGELIYHGSLPQTQLQPIIDAFQKQYPGIKVTYLNLLLQDVAARLIMEAQANHISIDVATSNPTYVTPLLDRGIILQYDWTKTSDTDPSNSYYGGAFLGIYDVPFVYIYNTKLVTGNDIPKTAEDLLNPKWKGSKIAMTPVESSVSTIYPLWQQDQQKAIDYLNKMQQQNVFVVQRGPDVVTKVSGGESPLGVCSTSVLLPALAQNQSIGVCPISPSVFTPGGVYLPKNPPHPNAALLFASWLSSSDSKDARIAGGQMPALPSDSSDAAKLLAKNNINPIRITSVVDVNSFVDFAKKELDIMFKPK